MPKVELRMMAEEINQFKGDPMLIKCGIAQAVQFRWWLRQRLEAAGFKFKPAGINMWAYPEPLGPMEKWTSECGKYHIFRQEV
jgi:hypothetical protein